MLLDTQIHSGLGRRIPHPLSQTRLTQKVLCQHIPVKCITQVVNCKQRNSVMAPPRMLLLVLVALSLPGTALSGSSSMMVNKYDFMLAGGAGFIGGHGAPTGLSLRTGSPGTLTFTSAEANPPTAEQNFLHCHAPANVLCQKVDRFGYLTQNCES